MIVTDHQSSFLPWTPYWHKVLHSDIHVATTGVRFDFGGHQNRVKASHGWMTVNVDRKTKSGLIKDVEFNRPSLKKIARTIEMVYGAKANPYAYRVAPIIEKLEKNATNNLVALNETLRTTVLATLTGRPIQTILSEETSDRDTITGRLFDRLGKLDLPDEYDYLSGKGASYLNLDAVPEHVGVLKQQLPHNEPDETILRVLVREPDPQDYIMARYSYERVK